MEYVVSAMSIVNDLCYADGGRVNDVTGGGLFMLEGVLTVKDSVGFVTAAGMDFEEYHGDFFAANGLSTRGVHRTLPHTHYTTVNYMPNGGWTETSIYGHEYEREQAENTMVHGSWIAELCDAKTKAIYTESGAEELFWRREEVEAVRKAAPNALLMWEVPHYNTFNPKEKPLIFPALEMVDLFSVNLREARELFGVESEQEAFSAIRATGKTCYLRMGTRGSVVIMPGKPVTFVPSTGLDATVDPTGCGNCSTAAAMVGIAEGFSPARIAAGANVAADYNARQLGPCPVLTDALRHQIAAEADALAERAVILEE